MDNKEYFVDLVDYEGVYIISNLGRIIGVKINNGKCGRKRGEHYLSPKIGRAGYIYVALRDINGFQKNHLLHRLLAKSFIPNPLNKPTVNHINSIRTDNRLENLEWNTFSENNKHAHTHGFQKKFLGESHMGSKLSNEIVLKIRAEYVKHKVTMSFLSKKYNISKGAIQAILSRKSWSHI